VNFKAACERLGGTAAAVNSLPPRFFIPQPSSASPRAKPRFTTELMQAMLDAGQAVLEQPGLAEKIAATRGWQVPTIIALVKQAALGWHDGKLAFFFEHGLKVRWRDGAGERRFAWIYGGNELWRAEHIRPETRWIFITEGETDAISLVDAGLEADGQTAVVAVPGAAAWKAEWGERLRGRDVILCTDADGAGDKAAERIEMDLAGVAARVARINPRELFNHQEAAK
jgi:5S rRNA maturation endonuclease (ribonuclease M5)